MPNVLLSNDDITVLGPPETLELQLDIGAQGTRGSKFFVGSGDPNAQTSSGILGGQTLQLNDLYLNASPSATYGYIFQYVAEPGGNVWVEVLDINPTIYSNNYVTTFEDGDAQIVIPVEDIITVSGTPLTAENFNVNYSIAYTNPIASSMEIPALAGSNLIINLHAVEYDTSTWLPLGDTGTYTSGVEVTTHLQITIVP
jgi:hypothetical protein